MAGKENSEKLSSCRMGLLLSAFASQPGRGRPVLQYPRVNVRGSQALPFLSGFILDTTSSVFPAPRAPAQPHEATGLSRAVTRHLQGLAAFGVAQLCASPALFLRLEGPCRVPPPGEALS